VLYNATIEEHKKDLENIRTLSDALAIVREGELLGVTTGEHTARGWLNIDGGRFRLYISDTGATLRDAIARGDEGRGIKLSDRASALLLAAVETVDRERWDCVRVFYNKDCAKYGVQEWGTIAGGGRGWTQIDPEKASGAVYTPVEGVAKRWARDLAIKHRRPLYLETTFILSVLELDNMTIKK
jgi:hypothetical protein